MLNSQLVLLIIYCAFAGLFFATRRGGETRAIARRALFYFGLMAGLSLLAGVLMLLTA